MTDVPDRRASASLAELPEMIWTIAATANDPLEVAAALEARGISSRQARERFGREDVFALAERIMAARADVPRSPEHVEDRLPRFGRPVDLVRGAMFAIPGLMFNAAIVELHLRAPSWTYLLALTVAWGFGQAIAATTSLLEGRSLALGGLAVLWVVVGGGVTAALAYGAEAARGGDWHAIVVATVVSLYVIACSILLSTGRTWTMAAPLLPAAAVSAAVLLHHTAYLPRAAALGVLVGAVGVTIVASLWPRPVRSGWRLPALSRADLEVGSRYFLHGLLCGLGTSLVIVLAARSMHAGSAIPLAAYPVLATLGVMEWQLRSFRARVERALRAAGTARQFSRLAVRSFTRSLLAYAVALAGVCVLAGWYLTWHDGGASVPVLVAEFCLGGTFFVGLVASYCARLTTALVVEISAGVLYGGLFAAWHVERAAFSVATARVCGVATLAGAFAVSTVAVVRTVRSAFSYR